MSTSITKLRATLRARFGARRYRITRQGEVHAYGEMPNSIITGWYLVGWAVDMRAAIKQAEENT